jgi:hypothetical protein
VRPLVGFVVATPGDGSAVVVGVNVTPLRVGSVVVVEGDEDTVGVVGIDVGGVGSGVIMLADGVKVGAPVIDVGASVIDGARVGDSVGGFMGSLKVGAGVAVGSCEGGSGVDGGAEAASIEGDCVGCGVFNDLDL